MTLALPARPAGLAVRAGLPECRRHQVAALFWQAFEGKLGRVMAPPGRARAFVAAALRPENALIAEDAAGRLLGVAGIKTTRGGLVGGGLAELAAAYGWPGALWRGPLLDLTDRPLAPGQMMIDGLFVDAAARGRGVGSALIAAALDEAPRRGAGEVRVDVVDSNARARALYERWGFAPAVETRLGPLGARLFGFRAAVTMLRRP
jgi:GNAT superfamily N-acetyltransferase